MEVKRDCFAYKKIGREERCIALRHLYCKHEECAFYKKSGTLCDGCTNTERGLTCINCRMARDNY